jgi:hypothetical protein
MSWAIFPETGELHCLAHRSLKPNYQPLTRIIPRNSIFFEPELFSSLSPPLNREEYPKEQEIGKFKIGFGSFSPLLFGFVENPLYSPALAFDISKCQSQIRLTPRSLLPIINRSGPEAPGKQGKAELWFDQSRWAYNSSLLATRPRGTLRNDRAIRQTRIGIIFFPEKQAVSLNHCPG